MVPYYVMVAIPAILSLLFSGRTDKFSAEKKNKVVTWFFFAILLVILMVRHEKVGVDIKYYVSMFKQASNFSWKEIFKFYEDEYGYYLLNKAIGVFTDNNQVLLGVIAIICIIPLACLYSRNSENAILTISIFLIISNFAILFSALRQAIAIAIVATSYKYIKEKKVLKFILIIVLAFFFHKSALIALLLYPIYHMNITKMKLLVLVPVIGFVFAFRNQIYVFMLQFLGEYGETYELSESSGYAMILLFALFLLLAYVAPDENKMDKETIGLRNMMVLTLMIQIFVLASPMAMRMNYYSAMFVPLLIPKIINRCHDKNKKTYQYIGLGLIVFFILYYFYKAYTGEDTLQIYPYRGFWK